MSLSLIASLLGLALLDALNPATIAGVALILLAPLRRPVAAAGAFVAGALCTVLAVGAAAYAGLDAAAGSVADGLVWLRRAAVGLAAVALAHAGRRRLRTRVRPAVELPRWLSPASAAPLGVLMTGADLPNAFPYFIAIERVANAGVPLTSALVLLAGYAVVYCLPCLVLLGLGAAFGERIRERLSSIYARLGSERVVPASAKAAVSYLAGAFGLGLLAVTV